MPAPTFRLELTAQEARLLALASDKLREEFSRSAESVDATPALQFAWRENAQVLRQLSIKLHNFH